MKHKVDIENALEVGLILLDISHPNYDYVLEKIKSTKCYGYSTSLTYLKSIQQTLIENGYPKFTDENWFYFGYVFTKQR